MKAKTKFDLIKENKQRFSIQQLSINEVLKMGFKRFAFWYVCPHGQIQNQKLNTFFYHPEERIIIAKPGGYAVTQTQKNAYWKTIAPMELRHYDDGNMKIENPKIFELIYH